MFTVMMSLLGALALVAQRGQGALVFRAVAWASHAEGVGAAVTLLKSAIRRVMLPSLALGVFGSVLLFTGVLGEPLPFAIYIMPISLLGIAVLAVLAGYSRGRGRTWLGPLFETGGISLVSTAILLVAFLAWGTLSALGLLVALLLSMSILLLVAGGFVQRDKASVETRHEPSQEQENELLRGQVAFILIGASVYLCQTGSFMVAAPFLSTSDVGLLRMAERIALLVCFPMLAIRPLIAPSMVRLARIGDSVGLKKSTLAGMAASAGLSLPILIILGIFPGFVLGVAGDEFTSAVPILYVMLLAQFIVAGLGPLAGLLHMTNRENASTWINVATLVLALVLFATLTSTNGAMGFAIAYALTNIGRLSAIAVYILVTGILGPNVAKASE
jgi:O-antigen/teichoic acid export membrane protein